MSPAAAFVLLENRRPDMTMMTTVIAVALGFAPVPADGTVNFVGVDTEKMIGRYSETVDDTGTTHLRGLNRRTGKIYHITVNPYGRVEGSVGDWTVSFNIKATS
jgi:hypothetical protein